MFNSTCPIKVWKSNRSQLFDDIRFLWTEGNMRKWKTFVKRSQSNHQTLKEERLNPDNQQTKFNKVEENKYCKDKTRETIKAFMHISCFNFQCLSSKRVVGPVFNQAALKDFFKNLVSHAKLWSAWLVCMLKFEYFWTSKKHFLSRKK